MASMRGVGRGGMQVHAVPESERAFDSTGRQLPWGYEYADSELNARRLPEEKGPFGKSSMRRRGTSRSKTFTPARKEDQAKIDNIKTIDDIFGSFKANLKTEEAGAAAAAALQAELGPLVNPTIPVPNAEAQEPTEVVIFGFGADFQWAAIEFFERVSGGIIYEDYEREPPHQKFNQSLSQSRARASQSLSQTALRKKNQYVGGNHWIKVTFDSPQSAEAACRASPHNSNGFAVYAQPYRGTGPREDVAITATYNDLANSNSPQTVRSSSTLPVDNIRLAIPAPASRAASNHFTTLPAEHPLRQSITHASQSSGDITTMASSNSTATVTATAPRKANTLRVRGARLAVLKPAEEALLPVVPRWQQAFAGIPILGSLVGGSTSLIGNEVPRKEDGTLDWNAASMYWWFWGCLDYYLGFDFCGLKPEE